jgi:hypothetical protein
MKVNRKLLYTGVFLVAAGAAMLVVEGEAVDGEVVTQALRFWPVLVIGLGVGLLLRGTRFGVAGGMLAAAMPGLLFGGLVVASPDLTPECRIAEPASYTTRQGTFDGAASVDLRLDCGELSVTTAPGTGWHVQTGDTRGAAPAVDSSADRLSVSSADQRHRFGFPWGGDAFVITLPADSTLDLAAEVNAGRGRLDLAGARLGEVRLDVNAGDVQVDLTGATLVRLSMDVNAAAASVRLPATGDFEADFAVNAAELNVCAPADLGLRIHQDVVLGSTTYSGLVRNGDAWETPGYSTATSHADVTLSVNVGSVDVNPEGGCK